jgi:hypothetical protein
MAAGYVQWPKDVEETAGSRSARVAARQAASSAPADVLRPAAGVRERGQEPRQRVPGVRLDERALVAGEPQVHSHEMGSCSPARLSATASRSSAA